jgi:hypothetical protein
VGRFWGVKNGLGEGLIVCVTDEWCGQFRWSPLQGKFGGVYGRIVHDLLPPKTESSVLGRSLRGATRVISGLNRCEQWWCLPNVEIKQ